ncbi:hypothetical protein pEaSNUABM12_00163 [Erwinia phage pEa_SNUABM_12]|uniref:Uncharacterized protein n=1 Tax=Erwinia phage pEa_SNUABM_12 TaxID=2768773 RepID=A0A7L8ZMF0_9CAUD|nr:hypothetical protein pEaSNUABM12_00163 [Erwinia phage pEa_SNUABM_12]
MTLSENKYFEQIITKYFLILIEQDLYQYRGNTLFIDKSSQDDRTLGIYNAMCDMAYIGENIVCVNFDKAFPIKHLDKLHFFIGNNAYYLNPVPCDFLFIFDAVKNREELNKIINFYNPKFIFYC